MKLVIDTNRIIAALITNSASRKIIKNIDYQFIAPDYSLEEIRKYKDEICKKSELDEEEFAVLLDLIFNNIAAAKSTLPETLKSSSLSFFIVSMYLWVSRLILMSHGFISSRLTRS